ncbi:MAG TPA: hypothetical protein DEF05_11315 [Erwinia sp.]|nr:hypothetical protein [Erwinia sp.]
MVNINFQLASALLTGKVNGVISGYRDIEALKITLQGKQPVVFNVKETSL